MGLIDHIVRACRELTTKIIIISKVTSRLVESGSTRSKNNLVWFCFPIIFLVTISLFYPSFGYYFFQDDWFVLNWVQNSDILSLLGFRQDIIYWRPISMPIFFKTGQLLFGYNPFGLHLILLAVHLINSFLVFYLFRTLKFTMPTALVISLLYSTASSHLVPLSWLSTASYVIGPLFILLSLIFYLKNKFFLSFIVFLLALASSEFAIVFIPIAAILKQQRLVIKPQVPFIAVTLVYLVLRFFIFPIPSEGSYEISFGPKVLTNLAWYLAWTFNIPEKISTIFFFTNLKGSILAVLPFFKVLIFPLIFATAALVLLIKTKLDLGSLARGIIWFIAGISPILFLPAHIYPMYVVIAALGIFYILAKALDRLKKYQPQVISVLAIIWFISSLLTLSFTRANHWIVNQQAISKAYIKQVQQQTEKPQSGTIFIFKPADIGFSRANNFVLVETEDNIKQSLNDQDAMQVIFKNSTLKSVYTTHQKPVNLPPDTKVIEVSPRGD